MELLLLFVGILGSSSGFRRDLFGETTAYRWIVQQLANASSLVENDLYIVANGEGGSCKAIQFTGVLRHGSRYPLLSDINKMNDLHRLIKDEILDTHQAIKQWWNRFQSSQNSRLNAIGAFEHKGLGSRFAKHFKSLFSDAQLSTEFVSSNAQRAIHSAKNFHMGMEEIIKWRHVSPMSPHIDRNLTMFYDRCPKFINSVRDNRTVLIEARKFYHGTVINNLTNYVNKELFGDHRHVNASDVRLMVDYCSYELNPYGSSAWCSLFDDWGLEAIEYLFDLEMYYVRSYGHKINYEQSCPLMSDIFYNMDQFVYNNNTNQDRLINKFIFGHTETILPLSAAFGLFKDDVALRADNFEIVKNRSFVVSGISPFAGNMALILYQCDNPITTTKVKQYQSNYAIRLLTNEHENEFPGCNTKLCPYSFVREKYSEYIDHCDFDDRCRVD